MNTMHHTEEALSDFYVDPLVIGR